MLDNYNCLVRVSESVPTYSFIAGISVKLNTLYNLYRPSNYRIMYQYFLDVQNWNERRYVYKIRLNEINNKNLKGQTEQYMTYEPMKIVLNWIKLNLLINVYSVLSVDNTLSTFTNNKVLMVNVFFACKRVQIDCLQIK